MSGQDPKRNKGRTDVSNVDEGSALVLLLYPVVLAGVMGMGTLIHGT